MAEADEADILFEQRGAAGLVTLNRPRALNALTPVMIAVLHTQLEAWAQDDDVTRVVVRGASGRAFCAGGDVRTIYMLDRAGKDAEVRDFWRAEYSLIALIGRYAKPYVSLIEGIVMGGGVGLSVHGSHRVACASYGLAMPEVGIGLFPDVGMTYALPRLPGRTGTYLALTGARIGPGDALAVGLATHYAAATDFDALVAALAGGGAIDTILGAHAAPEPAPGVLVEERAVIDRAFAGESVADVLARLDAAAAAGSAFAADAAASMRSRSPTSLSIAHEQMRRGPDLTLPQAILTEFRLAIRAMQGHDFFEGVRAMLIDKDGAPAWQPPRLEDVSPAAVQAAFAPLDGFEPGFT
ncbi:enoyl-CoA hydratase/isomerase family protein [Methylobacterium sp. BTF04]|uniref:enoyl-CoA hydratase/isomerase family protein n=1 Tax=Methylobacterium sp. BTF04 TaxID=2708300 RepID=UPI0013D6E070|nr:enoyl-CoA hydratase/isomerase family protein [Methylobacterium sp. BTF04]NEU13124.1 enoyl-CoA hydratase/isomerase family protein [Methylobacterium sp. BTF04]